MKRISERALERGYWIFNHRLPEIQKGISESRGKEIVREILAGVHLLLSYKRTQYLNKRRLMNVKARNKARKANYARGRFIDKNRKHRLWTNEELEIIIFSLLTDREISKMIKRTVQAIQMKRYLLRKGDVDVL